jgi:hypothetical protein
MRIDTHIVAQQINNLMLLYPELAEDETLRADMIEAETETIDVLRKIEQARREAAAMAGAIAANIADLELRQKRFERRESAMRELAFRLMQIADLRKLELPEATYSMCPVPPSVLIMDESALPHAAVKFIRKPDKTEIKRLLQFGPVAGATMSNGAMTLSIRNR